MRSSTVLEVGQLWIFRRRQGCQLTFNESADVGISTVLRDPGAAHDTIPIVENGRLSWRDSALRLIERH